jgi:hypothetical protein
MDPTNRKSYVQEAKRNNNLFFVTWSLPANEDENCHLTYIHLVAAIRSLANHKSSTSSGSFVSYKWRWTSVISTHASHKGSCQHWWTLLKTTTCLKKHVRRLWPVPLHRLYFRVDLVLSELDFNFSSGPLCQAQSWDPGHLWTLHNQPPALVAAPIHTSCLCSLLHLAWS